MLSKWIRTWNGSVFSPFLTLFEKLRISPDILTVGGLISHIITGCLFALGQFGWGLAALLVGQLLDSLDGELARRFSRESSFGGFLDSVCDHLGDFAVYLGLLWYYLGVNGHVQILLIAAAMFGSVFGSHVRSRAGMLGIDTRWAGAFTRFERTLVLTVCLLLHQLTLALWVLAVLNNFSALQRVWLVVRAARAKPREVQGKQGA